MKTKRLYLPMFVLGLLGISVGGVACSDGGTADPSGTGGAPVAGTGGTVSTGGQTATGGATNGGSSGTGGVSATAGTGGSGGSAATGGSATGGTSTGGSATGGMSAGGTGGGGGMATGGTSAGGAGGRGGMATGGTSAGGAGGRGGMATGGTSAGGGGRGGSATGGTAAGGTGGQGSGTCTASKSTGRTVSGTGPHQVVVETNADNGIKCGTIYRPADLGGTEKYPIFVWGEGGCSQDGYSNQAAMAEIASWGYFIVADGTPGEHERLRGRARWEGVPRLHHVGDRRERQVVQRVLPEPRDHEDRGGRILVRWIDGRECLG